MTFANRTGGYYEARIANQIHFEKVFRGNPHCTFAVNFRCYPFFYADAADDITVTTSGTMITNPGSVYSRADPYGHRLRGYHAHGRNNHCGTGGRFR